VLLGQFRLGWLVRFFPYSVIGGFLAGTGWLLLLGGIGVITGGTGDLASVAGLLQSRPMQVLTGVLFGAGVLVVSRRVQHVLLLPGLLLAATVLFYLWLAVAGISVAQAQARGWLLGPFTTQPVWTPLTPARLAEVQWPAIVAQAGAIGTTVALSVIGLLLNVSGLQLARREDIDLNQELRASGVAQFAAGLAGSSPGFPALGLSALSHRLGARTRLVGVITGLVCIAAFVAGAEVLALVPRVVLGGMVCYLGFAFLSEWLYDTWFELPRGDYALIVAILALIVVFGMLPGIVAGLAIAVVLFVVAYSRVDVVRHTLSGATVTSRMTRAEAEQAALHAHGGQIAIYQLQGFVFFGTAHALYERVRARVLDEHLPAVRFVLLDCRLVPRIDVTALLSFTRMLQFAQRTQHVLVFTHLAPPIKWALERRLLHGEGQGHVRMFSDLDHGLEWCENEVLTALGSATTHADDQRVADLEACLRHFEQRTVLPGHYLMRQGDRPEEMFFVASGQVTAQTEPADGPPRRLETMRGGHMVGELGFLLGRERTASVVADEPSRVYRITQAMLERLEQTDPQAAAVFHRHMARLLSERVVHLIDTVEALQR
jgi:sulfate permease, SulP family